MPDVYAEKATWFTGMADEVRRLSETDDKLTTADMLAKMQDMTLGGGFNGLYTAANGTGYLASIDA